MREDLVLALNHVATPRLRFVQFVELAKKLGIDAVEIRNDLPKVEIADGTKPADVRATAEKRGVVKVQFRAQGSGNHDLYVDDVYVCDTSGTQNNDFLGDVRVETLRANADTAQADWTPSTGTDHAESAARQAPSRACPPTAATGMG